MGTNKLNPPLVRHLLLGRQMFNLTFIIARPNLSEALIDKESGGNVHASAHLISSLRGAYEHNFVALR